MVMLEKMVLDYDERTLREESFLHMKDPSGAGKGDF